jgi:hypothetical protein
VAKGWTTDIISSSMFKRLGFEYFPVRLSDPSSNPDAVVVYPTEQIIHWNALGTVAFPLSSAIRSGNAYYELEILEVAPRKCCQFGWGSKGMTTSCRSGVGDDFRSWGVDGIKPGKWGKVEINYVPRIGDKIEARSSTDGGWFPATVEKAYSDSTFLVKWDDGSTSDRLKTDSAIRKKGSDSPHVSAFGSLWKVGDIIGIACGTDNQQIVFSTSVNGSFESPNGTMFQLPKSRIPDGVFPALTASGMKVRFNFGTTNFAFPPHNFFSVMQYHEPKPLSQLRWFQASFFRLTIRNVRCNDDLAHASAKTTQLSNVQLFYQEKIIKNGKAIAAFQGSTVVGDSAENITLHFKSRKQKESWIADLRASTLIFQFPHQVVADSYILTTGDDCPEKDPVSWILEGSLDGQSWTILDTKENFTPPDDRISPYSTFYFENIAPQTQNPAPSMVQLGDSDSGRQQMYSAISQNAQNSNRPLHATYPPQYPTHDQIPIQSNFQSSLPFQPEQFAGQQQYPTARYEQQVVNPNFHYQPPQTNPYQPSAQQYQDLYSSIPGGPSATFAQNQSYPAYNQAYTADQ